MGIPVTRKDFHQFVKRVSKPVRDNYLFRFLNILLTAKHNCHIFHFRRPPGELFMPLPSYTFIAPAMQHFPPSFKPLCPSVVFSVRQSAPDTIPDESLIGLRFSEHTSAVISTQGATPGILFYILRIKIRT